MKKLILIILGVVLLNTGCDKLDFGDVNENINGTQTINTASFMQGAMMRFATTTGRPYRLTPSLYVQWLTQKVYTDEMLYSDVPQDWNNYYVQTLSNLDLVIRTCRDPKFADDSLVSGNMRNQIAISKIFRAYVFKRITDTWGDIPYSEALQKDIRLPAYDTQESIYRDMIKQVKEGRDSLLDGVLKVKGDVFYGAATTAAIQNQNWRRFANSFLLQLTLQMSKRFPLAAGYAGTEFASAVANTGGMVETPAQEFWYTFDVLGGFNSPWSWMRSADYAVSAEFHYALKGDAVNNTLTSNRFYDRRIRVFTTDPTKVSIPYGYNNPPGGISTTASSAVKLTARSADTRFPLMRASYTWLNRAEGAALGWSTEVAATCLTNGIDQSFASFILYWDPTNLKTIGTTAVAYRDARVVDAGVVAGGIRQVIAEEKWVALFPQSFEAWSEWRRTNYPVLVPATDAYNNGTIPRRYNYPSVESSLNVAGYTDGVSALTPATDNNSSKFWWDL